MISSEQGLSVPVSEPCSQIEGYGEVEVPPGAFTNSTFTIAVLHNPGGLWDGGNGGTWTPYAVCNFNTSTGLGGPGNGTCSGSTPVTISAGDQIMACLRASYATPPHTQFGWSFTCTNP